MRDIYLDEKVELLKKADIFSSLKDDELEIISNYSNIYRFEKGEMIFQDDITANELFIIRKGDVLIYRNQMDGKRLILAHYIEGETFGELDLFTNLERNFEAKAENETEILIFPMIGIDFQYLISKHPQIFAQILHKFMIMIANRIRNVNKLVSERAPWVEELKKQLYKDKLTGLYNNTYLDEEFPKSIGDFGKSLSFLYIKPDNFKDINDCFGHEVGDVALKFLADSIKANIGNYIVARYRGNESSAILPGISKAEAYKIADKLRDAICNLNIKEITNGSDFYIKVSVGIVEYPNDVSNPKDILKSAYDKMMIARESGGNKVVM
ncbi:MAG: Response regulator PleD [Spirochaetes bacterium ADurb.Bin133]|jgi:diguanylate cyclase (GGDEF)-like protein|nr:MAG: Response regulator PleD [Spirochaetes bacterium ADurb.Bin133]